MLCVNLAEASSGSAFWRKNHGVRLSHVCERKSESCCERALTLQRTCSDGQRAIVIKSWENCVRKASEVPVTRMFMSLSLLSALGRCRYLRNHCYAVFLHTARIIARDFLYVRVCFVLVRSDTHRDLLWKNYNPAALPTLPVCCAMKQSTRWTTIL